MAIVLPSTWGRDPPGRLPWGVTRGLTNRLPLDDASVSIVSGGGLVQDIVGNAYGVFDTVVPAFIDGPPGVPAGISNATTQLGGTSSSRALHFGAGGSILNAIHWPSAPIPQTGWTGTISLWVWQDQFAATDGQDTRLVCIGTTTPVLIATTSGGNAFDCLVGSTENTFINQASTFTPGWCHLAMTWDGTTLLGYFNGVVQTAGAPQGDATSPGNYSFGGRYLGSPGSEDRGLVGRMADLRFYTGTVLTANEINQLYLSAFIQDPGYGYTLPDEGEMPALFTPAAPPPVAASTALGFIEVEW